MVLHTKAFTRKKMNTVLQMHNSDSFGGYYNRTSARYPYYFEKVHRQRSFFDWPADKQQRPEELAEAGFYHAGPQDCTRCFYCGGGIKNWSPGDIPAVEHARWFSHCQYIISKKGEDFVNNVNINFPRHTETDGPREERKFEAKDYDELIGKILKSSAGKALEILDFKPDIIQAACAKVLNFCSWDIKSVRTEDLAKEAIELETKHRDSEASKEEHPEGAVGGATGQQPFATNSIDASEESDSEEILRNFELFSIDQHAESGRRDNPTNDLMKEEGKLNEKMSELLLENRKLRDERTCKICLEKDVCVIFLPCRHLVTCEDCHASLTKCPLCRGEIAAAVKAYM